jgi:hypothetical protein
MSTCLQTRRAGRNWLLSQHEECNQKNIQNSARDGSRIGPEAPGVQPRWEKRYCILCCFDAVWAAIGITSRANLAEAGDGVLCMIATNICKRVTDKA